MYSNVHQKEQKSPLESFKINCYIPKINVFEAITDSRYKFEAHATHASAQPIENPKLGTFPSIAHNSLRNSILQGEYCGFIAVMEKLENEPEIDLKSKDFQELIKHLKFRVVLTKHDASNNSERIISMNARYLESQIFWQHRELEMVNNNQMNAEIDEQIFEYYIDMEKELVFIAAKIPISIPMEFIDVYLSFRLTIYQSQGQRFSQVNESLEIRSMEDMFFNTFNNKHGKKGKKPPSVTCTLNVKFISIFQISSDISVFGNNTLIAITMKNVLGEVIDTRSKYPQFKLTIENIEFFLSSSISKNQFDPNAKQSINTLLNDMFVSNILGETSEIEIDESTVYSLVIQISRRQDKPLPPSEGKILIFKNESNQHLKSSPENGYFVIETTKCGIEAYPETPSTSSFRHSNEVTQASELSSKHSEAGTPARKNFPVQTPISSKSGLSSFKETDFSFERQKTIASSVSEVPEERERTLTSIVNSNLKRRRSSLRNSDLKLIVDKNLIMTDSKLLKIPDTGLSVHIYTPLYIRWSLGDIFSQSMITKVIWNTREINIIDVTCRKEKSSYRVEEKIEIELVVTNRSINDLEFTCMLPETFESGVQTIDPLQEDARLEPTEEDKEQKGTEIKYLSKDELPEFVRQTTKQAQDMPQDNGYALSRELIKKDHVIAIPLEKSINIGVLKSGEQTIRKVSLLPISKGLLRIEYFVFLESTSGVYIKATVPMIFEII